jgi:hypothetical protein
MKKMFTGTENFPGSEEDAFGSMLKVAFTPYRPWEAERKVAASAKSRAIRAAKIAEQTDKIFDPSNEFTETKKMILARLLTGGERAAYDISNAAWPTLEEMDCWFSIRDLVRDGYVWASTPNLWRISGCGLLRAAVQL